MHVALVHGYFLADSGSAIYVRELAHEFLRQGHEVTLVCQEQRPEDFGFINSAYQLDSANTKLQPLFEHDRTEKASCRLVRPDIHGRLLTYVAGPFPGFEARPFQDAPDAWIDSYIKANLRALETIFTRWPPDLVQANHAVMQPLLVRRGLEIAGHSDTPYVVTIHGSDLNFTVRTDPRMVPYAIEGLEGAWAIAALSTASRDETTELAAGEGLDIAYKTHVMPPGVDTGMFGIGYERSDVMDKVSAGIDPEADDILVFTGRLLWTKGPQYVIAALPLMLKRRSRIQLVVVGDGPMREPLLELIEHLDAGDLEAAESLVASSSELRQGDGYGPVLPVEGEERRREYSGCLDAIRGEMKKRIHCLGHLPHEALAPLFAASDLSLAPSVFAEAFGLVSVEAMAAGALPVATYQTGLRDPLDVIHAELQNPLLQSLVPGRDLTTALADTVIELLEAFPTKSREFRKRLHGLAVRDFSWSVLVKRYLHYARI